MESDEFKRLSIRALVGAAQDYRLLEQLALVFDITEKLSFKVSLDIKHDNEPPINVRQTDTSYNTGVEYRF